METFNKSMQLLHFTVFKPIVFFVVLTISGCKPEVYNLEWFFYNNHNDVITLSLFSSDERVTREFPEKIQLNRGDSVRLYSISVEQGNSSLFTDLIDSAIVYRLGNDDPLIIWRKSGEYFFRDNFHVAQDFYSWDNLAPTFDYIAILATNHIRYRFFLPDIDQFYKVDTKEITP